MQEDLSRLKQIYHNLRYTIRCAVLRGADINCIKDKVTTYNNYKAQLIQTGQYQFRQEPVYLSTEYWEEHTVEDCLADLNIKSKSNIPRRKSNPIPRPITPEIKIERKPPALKEPGKIQENVVDNYYILYIAWEGSSKLVVENGEKMKEIYNKFNNYINTIFPNTTIDMDTEDNYDMVAYVIKCKVRCNLDAFNILKKTVIYMLNDSELEIYGKKLK